MRSALFSPLQADDSAVPALVETSVFSQWFHSGATLHYARWADGEVDIVTLDAEQKVSWAVEVKWSDRFCDDPRKLENLIEFCRRNKVTNTLVTSRTKSLRTELEGIRIHFIPASVYCYTVGYNIVHGRINVPTAVRRGKKA